MMKLEANSKFSLPIMGSAKVGSEPLSRACYALMLGFIDDLNATQGTPLFAIA
jgi:hypothetical protein